MNSIAILLHKRPMTNAKIISINEWSLYISVTHKLYISDNHTKHQIPMLYFPYTSVIVRNHYIPHFFPQTKPLICSMTPPFGFSPSSAGASVTTAFSAGLPSALLLLSSLALLISFSSSSLASNSLIHASFFSLAFVSANTPSNSLRFLRSESQYMDPATIAKRVKPCA